MAQNGRKGERLAHLVWADNLWLIAEAKAQMQTMVDMTTKAIREAGFEWKKQSLEQLISEGQEKTKETNIAIEGEEIRYTPVKMLLVLGNMISIEGDTSPSLEARLSSANKRIYKEIKTWANYAPGAPSYKIGRKSCSLQYFMDAARQCME